MRVGQVYRSAIDGYSAQVPAAATTALAADPRVSELQRDRQVHTTAQTTPTGINRSDADLSPTAAIARNCSIGLSADDDNGHGSHVAGTIGVLDNTSVVVGMAPGARLWPVKVLNAAGSGFTSDVICGVDYVTANAGAIEVANMSLGGGGSDDGNCGRPNDDAQHEAICASVAGGRDVRRGSWQRLGEHEQLDPRRRTTRSSRSARSPTSTASPAVAGRRPAAPTRTTPSPASPTTVRTST